MTDEMHGYYTWYVQTDRSIRQDGNGVDCGLQHARSVGESIHWSCISQQQRLRPADLLDHTPQVSILIARDGKMIERFQGRELGWQVIDG